MSEREPVRLFDAASGADERVRRCLAAGRDELPTDAQLAALAARLGPLLGPGGGAPPGGATGGGTASGGGGGGTTVVGGGAGAAAAGSHLGKAAGVALLAAALAGGGLLYSATRTTEPAPIVATPATNRPDLTPEVVPRGVDPADLPATPTAPDASANVPPPPHGPVAARPAVDANASADAATPEPPAPDPDAELALVRAAQDALGAGEPGRALAQAAEHARRFPGGTLAQEREVVAIDALARLGRAADARQRAEAFQRRWPRSAHGRRIEVILARLPPP